MAKPGTPGNDDDCSPAMGINTWALTTFHTNDFNCPDG